MIIQTVLSINIEHAFTTSLSRWSQIMYMYYLLGYKIMELPISDERKEARAENTYLLALDGDVDFQPEAVIRCDILLQHIFCTLQSDQSVSYQAC